MILGFLSEKTHTKNFRAMRICYCVPNLWEEPQGPTLWRGARGHVAGKFPQNISERRCLVFLLVFFEARMICETPHLGFGLVLRTSPVDPVLRFNVNLRFSGRLTPS